MRRRSVAAISLQVVAALCAAHPCAAASLQEVTGFGNNPSNAKMYLYVPDRVAAAPPVLVAIHYCGGSANAYFGGTGYRALADRHGFIVIYPQTTSGDGCFDVHSEATLKHEGGSDSLGIVSMVRHTLSKYGANANRVYVTGSSSGAMMTNVLLGAYPEVFRGGAAFAGVPYGCFAGQSGWSTACANGQLTKTGQVWGDLVRAAYPGYSGPRPRVQLWHGTNDDTLDFHNFGEAIKQWTNVLGVPETPRTTEQNAPQSSWTRTRYQDSAGVVRVEGVVETGVSHNLTVPAAEVVRFFGLDGAADPGGSSGGAGGSAGMGSGGAGSGGTGAPSGGGSSSGGSASGGTTGSGSASSPVPSGGTPAAGGGGGIGAGAAAGAATTGGASSQGTGGAGSIGGAGTSTGSAGSGDAPAIGVGGAPGATDASDASEPSEASSSCSVHTGVARTGGSATGLAVLVGSVLRAIKRTRRRGSRRGTH